MNEIYPHTHRINSGEQGPLPPRIGLRMLIRINCRVVTTVLALGLLRVFSSLVTLPDTSRNENRFCFEGSHPGDWQVPGNYVISCNLTDAYPWMNGHKSVTNELCI